MSSALFTYTTNNLQQPPHPYFLCLINGNHQSQGKGAVVEFIKENLTFTGLENSPMSNLMLSVMGAFAEFERALIKERQMEGIALAKKRGVYKGRKKLLSDEQIQEMHEMLEDGESKTDTAKTLGISRETLYKYLRRSYNQP